MTSWVDYLISLPNEAEGGLSDTDKGRAAGLLILMPEDQRDFLVEVLQPTFPVAMSAAAMKTILGTFTGEPPAAGEPKALPKRASRQGRMTLKDIFFGIPEEWRATPKEKTS